MIELKLQVVEETKVSKRWHFYPFKNAIHVTINKDFDKNHDLIKSETFYLNMKLRV